MMQTGTILLTGLVVSQPGEAGTIDEKSFRSNACAILAEILDTGCWINRDSGFENYLGRYVSHPDKVGTHRGRREKP